MSANYFKYKALSLTSKGDLDDRSMVQVVEPIIESYFYLPTREKLNDPNEGLFQNQIQAGISAFLIGVTGLGERTDLATSLYALARQISQSTDVSGVYSLSRNSTDELMWAHYGGSHCGLIIEYDLDKLTRFCAREHLQCFNVEYVNEPPNLDIQRLQGKSGQAIRAMLGHKSPRWSYEEEFRIVLENMNGRLPHDYRAIKSITFGLKVSEQIRDKIFELTKHKVSEYYEIRKISGTYLLERCSIEKFLGGYSADKVSNIDWSTHFQNLNGSEKERMIGISKREIDSDPHFEELLWAEKSTTNSSQAVLQYQAKHHLGLNSLSKYTKYYYDL